MSRIGIKLDGIVINQVEFQKRYGSFFFKRNPRSVQPYVSSFRSMFSCTKEENDKFWKRYYVKYCLSQECEKDSVDVINQLKQDDNEIFLIVTRPFNFRNNWRDYFSRKFLEVWLKKHQIKCDEIIVCDENDISEVCKQFEFNVLIEDKIGSAINASETVQDILLFDRPYNQGLEEILNITRVYKFKDVYSQINSDAKVRGLSRCKDIKY